MRARRVAELCEAGFETPVLQRLGWMLDSLGFQKLAASLAVEVRGRKTAYVPLNPSVKRRSGPRDAAWAIIVNEKPESEL